MHLAIGKVPLPKAAVGTVPIEGDPAAALRVIADLLQVLVRQPMDPVAGRIGDRAAAGDYPRPDNLNLWRAEPGMVAVGQGPAPSTSRGRSVCILST